MKVMSNVKPDQFFLSGSLFYIRFDMEEVDRTDMEGEIEKVWQYEEVQVPISSSKGTIIEAIISSRYETYGAEMAAFHNGEEEYNAFLAFRVLAKELAIAALDFIKSAKPVEDREAAAFKTKVAFYKKAIARLEQIVLSEGREESIEQKPTGNMIFDETTGEMVEETIEVVIPAIEPVPSEIPYLVIVDEMGETGEISEHLVEARYDGDNIINPSDLEVRMVPNPIVVRDMKERDFAQRVVDNATPEVIAYVNETEE